MASKIIFFDIDGTLINFGGDFPESAQKALRLAKENGHQIFLCTGRSKCQIENRLLEFGFDGFVSAAGAYVEHHGKEVYSNYMSKAKLSKLIDYVEGHGMVYMMQCTDNVVATGKCMDAIHENFKKMHPDSAPKNIEKIFECEYRDDNLKDNLEKYNNAEKVCYYNAEMTLEQIIEDLKGDFDVTAMSFNDVRKGSGEITAAGITKALGMEKLIEYLGISKEDTVAFGDGPNDFEMIDFAGIGVAMGNASDELKSKADMVTTHITEDGIYNGLKELKLI